MKYEKYEIRKMKLKSDVNWRLHIAILTKNSSDSDATAKEIEISIKIGMYKNKEHPKEAQKRHACVFRVSHHATRIPVYL